MSRRQLYLFLGIVISASWIAQTVLIFLVGRPDQPAALPYLGFVMFLPGAVGLAFTFASARVRSDVQWRPASVAPLVASVVLPAALGIAMLLVVTHGGLGSSDYFNFSRSVVHVASGPWLLGTGEQAWGLFVANVVATAAVYGCFASVVTLGEEFGWRGVLQPALLREFGLVRGIFILGLAWAAWHAPLILAGYDYPRTPVLGALVILPALLIAASFILAWLTLWNRSFWPAVLMHGGINTVYDAMTTRVQLEQGVRPAFDVLELAVFALVAWVSLFLARRLIAAR